MSGKVGTKQHAEYSAGGERARAALLFAARRQMQTLAVEPIQPLGQYFLHQRRLAAIVIIDSGHVSVRPTSNLARGHGLIAMRNEQRFRRERQPLSRIRIAYADSLDILRHKPQCPTARCETGVACQGADRPPNKRLFQ